MNRMEPRRIKIPLRHPAEKKPVPIVADGTMATASLARGRNIPILVLDTSSRPDIETMIRAHGQFGPGDARSGWSFRRRWFRFAVPVLYLAMEKPSRCLIVIEFDLVDGQGTLVDLILWAKGVYLQAGRPGDRVGTTVNEPRILVEVSRSDLFARRFRPAHERAIYRRFRKTGMSRSGARNATGAFLGEWRGFFHRHFPLRAERNVEGGRSGSLNRGY